nr:hypothetical protein [Tanacetum cinerariifolium]
MHSEGQDSPISKLFNTIDGKFKFEMKIPDIMINDAIKQLAGYKFYIMKKDESEKGNAKEEPEEQHVSPVRSERGKDYMCIGNREVNVSSKPKKVVVPRKSRTTIVADNIIKQETMAAELAKSVSIKEKRLQQRQIMTQLTIKRQVKKYVKDTYAVKTLLKLKGIATKDPVVQSLLDLRKGSKESKLKSIRQERQVVGDTDEDKYDETHDAKNSDMDIFDNDYDKGDVDDAYRFGVFVYNKSQELPKFTPFSPVVIFSFMEDVTNLLNDSSEQELMDLLSKLVYTDAQTTSMVANPKGNSKKLQHNLVTNPRQSLIPEKTKNLMEKAKRNKRKSIFKHAFEKKFKEYNQKLEALSSINVPKAIKKAIRAKINLYTTPSPTTIDDMSEIDLKLMLLNKMYKSKSFESHDTYHKLYDVLYESIRLDQESLDAQDTEPSSKRPHDDQDSLNNREREKRKKRRKDAGEPSSRSSKKDKVPMDSIQEYLLAINPKTKKKSAFKNFPMQDGLQRNYILGLSIVTVAKKIKELIKKDELTIADLEVNLSTEEKYTTSLTKHFAARYHIKGIEGMIPDRWSKKIQLYQINALNGIYHWEDARKDFFKAEMENLLKMVNKNVLGHGKKRLDGRDWSKNDIKRSNEMLEKIDKSLKFIPLRNHRLGKDAFSMPSETSGNYVGDIAP